MPSKPGTCLICGKIFSRSYHIKAHMLTHTNERPFKCSICGSFYRTKGELDSHSRYVHGGEKRPPVKKVQCIMCKKTTSKSNFNNHLRMHIREKPYSCSICDMDFVESSQLNRHLKSHEKLKGDPCIFCEKTLAIRSNPDDHIMSHIKEKSYFCKRCPSSFSHQGSLRAHVRNVHLKQRDQSCEICGKTFFSKAQRDIHLTGHLNEKPLQCTICMKRYKSSNGLDGHVRSHNGVPNPAFPCRKCNKVYSHQTSLAKHDKAKHQLTQCIFCEKDITTDFMFHLLKHTNERHLSCNSCEKDFQRLSHLQSHVRYIHSTERPFSCQICGKSFKTKEDRQQHIKSHLNEKPFPCTSCPKRFAKSQSLKIHLKTHTQGMPHK